MNRRVIQLISENVIEDEERRTRTLRFLADFACMVLSQDETTLEEGLRIVAGVKYMALSLFPDKEEIYDMIYGARFRRILSERFLLV